MRRERATAVILTLYLGSRVGICRAGEVRLSGNVVGTTQKVGAVRAERWWGDIVQGACDFGGQEGGRAQ